MADHSSNQDLPDPADAYATEGLPEQPPMDAAAGGPTADDADDSLPDGESVGDPVAADQGIEEPGNAVEDTDPDDLSVQGGE